jgi:phosphate transport system substrate-binding protein
VLIGQITDWRELGGKPGKINLYAVATPTDGVEYSIRRLVLGAGGAATSAERWYLNTERLEEAVTIDPAGLGISLYADVADNHALRTLALEGVTPSPEAVASGEYLLATPLYVVTRADASAASEAGKFLAFMDDREERANLRTHHLIPAAEAAEVAEAEGPRERFLADKLGYAVAVAAIPPAPAPSKAQPTNLSRLAQTDVRHPAAPKQPAVKGTALPRATAIAAETDKPHECLEQALCT